MATFISETKFGDIPEEAFTAAKKAIIDYIGVTLAGGRIEPVAKLVMNLAKDLQGKPEAGIICGEFKTSPIVAALTNGAVGHALDYDDNIPSSEGYNCHPTVCILPALLGLAEKHELPGKDLLAAYVVGFEVESRIGSVIGEYVRDMGWHSTSAMGSIAAAAAAASNIIKLNDRKTQVAIGIAASLAGGLLENVGTMTKSLHAGNAAKMGLWRQY